VPASSPVGAQAWLLPDSAFAFGSAAGSHLVSAVEVLAHSAVGNHLCNSSRCEALYKAFAQVLAHACAIQNTSWWMQSGSQNVQSLYGSLDIMMAAPSVGCFALWCR
jgi:hypothetical protein